ncbi:MAG: hypothetical protein RIS92_1573 [Verrucomicrobiota bacterium]|jgi:hypothetical protein
MKRIALWTLDFEPVQWHSHSFCPEPKLRTPLQPHEILVEPENQTLPRKCYRTINDKWEWAYIPFKPEIEPTLRWTLSTDIGAGIVLDVAHVLEASGPDLRFVSNKNESYFIVENREGDGSYTHSLYLTNGLQKAQSLLSFGHKTHAVFKIGPSGASLRTGETFCENAPRYTEIVTTIPEGWYEVFGYSGSLRICKTI